MHVEYHDYLYNRQTDSIKDFVKGSLDNDYRTDKLDGVIDAVAGLVEFLAEDMPPETVKELLNRMGFVCFEVKK